MPSPALVTGLGCTSALGSGAEAVWSRLLGGESGLGPLTRFKNPGACQVAAECPEPPAEAFYERSPQPRAVQLGLHAARQAYENAGLDQLPPDDVGLVVGTGLGNLDVLFWAHERIMQGDEMSELTAFRSFPHAAACSIIRELDIRGPSITVTTGCNAGSDALGTALDWIRLGRARAVLVGGLEAELNDEFFCGMEAADAFASRHNASPSASSRPFDVDRDGNVPGEGAAFLVLESAESAQKRRAAPLGRVLGYATRSAGERPDYSPTTPHLDQTVMCRSMRAALHDAGIAVDALGGISANGSSSVNYDALEARALRELLGSRAEDVPIFSIKGALGQTGAVTPALQAVTAVMALRDRTAPPTLNHATPEPNSRGLRISGSPQPVGQGAILCHSIGFGGFYSSTFVVGRVGA